MDPFARWKRESIAGHERIESTNHAYPEAEQYKRIDSYWVNVVHNIQANDPDAFRKIRYIREFARRPDGAYPLTFVALRSRVPIDSTPSIAQMNRELIYAEDEMLLRHPPVPRSVRLNMLDSKLTNYISDLRKDDPKYRDKLVLFQTYLESGDYPNALETFERKGHGKIDIPRNMIEGGRKTRRRRRSKGMTAGLRKTYRHRRGGGEAEQAALVAAVKRGSPEDIRAAISRGADVNVGVGTETPPLTLAIHRNRLDLVKLLVESGADVNKRDRMGGLPIVDAGEQHPEILGFLISRGARYPAGWRPRSTRLQGIFEKQGAIEVGVKKDLPTPVPSIIKGFLGGEKSADDELLSAIRSKNVDGVKVALARGADPNNKTIPLIEAVHTDKPELVQLLIDAGASVDTKGDEGGTALYWAVDNTPSNDVKINTIIKILLKAGANPQLVYDALEKYPVYLDRSKKAIERIRNPKMAIEVGVKKELPTPLPAKIRGFLGSSRRH